MIWRCWSYMWPFALQMTIYAMIYDQRSYFHGNYTRSCSSHIIQYSNSTIRPQIKANDVRTQQKYDHTTKESNKQTNERMRRCTIVSFISIILQTYTRHCKRFQKNTTEPNRWSRINSCMKRHFCAWMPHHICCRCRFCCCCCNSVNRLCIMNIGTCLSQATNSFHLWLSFSFFLHYFSYRIELRIRTEWIKGEHMQFLFDICLICWLAHDILIYIR